MIVLDGYGAKKVVVQPNRVRDSTYSIRLLNPFDERPFKRALVPFSLPAGSKNDLLDRSVSMQVQDVYADEKNAIVTNAVKDSTAFFGKADETYMLDDYTRFTVMEEVMREYVPGVLVRKRRDGFHFMTLDVVRKGLLRDDPLILLDGVPLFDADEIMNFDPLKVKKLEVVTRLYYAGTMNLKGIVSYSTYQGDMAGFELHPKVLKLDYNGLQLQREYYTPVYDDKKSRSGRLPDQRNLIYWAPQVTLSNGKKEVLPFYTSDLKGRFMVVIQSLSDDGMPASASTSFEVRRFDN